LLRCILKKYHGQTKHNVKESRGGATIAKSRTDATTAVYGLVYTQVQLAFVSLVIMGFYCTIMELEEIVQKVLRCGFNFPAYVSIFVSASRGLTVAAGEFHCII
jgi:hypothetical protein